MSGRVRRIEIGDGLENPTRYGQSEHVASDDGVKYANDHGK